MLQFILIMEWLNVVVGFCGGGSWSGLSSARSSILEREDVVGCVYSESADLGCCYPVGSICSIFGTLFVTGIFHSHHGVVIKLFERIEMDTITLAKMSTNVFVPTDFAQMEFNILSALNWQVQGSTVLSFIEHFLPSFRLN